MSIEFSLQQPINLKPDKPDATLFNAATAPRVRDSSDRAKRGSGANAEDRNEVESRIARPR